MSTPSTLLRFVRNVTTWHPAIVACCTLAVIRPVTLLLAHLALFALTCGTAVGLACPGSIGVREEEARVAGFTLVVISPCLLRPACLASTTFTHCTLERLAFLLAVQSVTRVARLALVKVGPLSFSQAHLASSSWPRLTRQRLAPSSNKARSRVAPTAMVLGRPVRHCCTDFAVCAAVTHSAFDCHTLEVRRQGMARVARKALSRFRSVQSLPANCTLRPLPLGAQQGLALKVRSQAVARVASFTLVVSSQVGRGLAGFARLGCQPNPVKTLDRRFTKQARGAAARFKTRSRSLSSAAQVLGAGEVILAALLKLA